MEKSFLKITKLSLAISMAFSVFACAPIKNLNSTLPQKELNSKISAKGVLSINLSNLFKNKGFNTKGTFSDVKIKQLKIEVYGSDISTKIIKHVDWVGGSFNQTVNIDIPQGKNRIVSVTGVDDIGQPISRLMSVVDIYANTTSTAVINYGTTAVARVLNNILNSNNKSVVDKLDIERLKRLITNITGYRDFDNTYFSNAGANPSPSEIDVFSISDRIIANDGYIDPDNTTDLKNKLAFGKLKVYVKDKSGNAVLSNVNLAVNDITGKAPVKVNNYSNIDVDQGVWEISAKVYINSNGTTINFPLNTTEERNLILNGGGILYAKQQIFVRGTQEQEINLNLTNLKVKEIQLFKDEKKLDNYETEINNPQDLDARVFYDDDSYSRDQVVWEINDSSVATITSAGVITGLKRASTNLKLISILDKDKTASFSINFKDPGLAPVINSFTGGPAGLLTIFGRNFDDQVPLNNIVKINGYKADVVEVTTEYIKVTIPNGGAVGSGKITVENTNGLKISDNIFVGNPILSIGGLTIASTPASGFIMGSLNSVQVVGVNYLLEELTRENRINQLIAPVPTIVYPSVTLNTGLVSALTAGQIKFIADYINFNSTTFANDVANAPAGTTLSQLLANTKYHDVENKINLLSIDSGSVLAEDIMPMPGFKQITTVPDLTTPLSLTVTTLNGDALLGATTITLNNTSTISVGQSIKINNQTLNIQAVNGNNITFTPALLSAATDKSPVLQSFIAPIAAGATTLPLTSSAEIAVGQKLSINNEIVSVTSVNLLGNTVTFTPPLTKSVVSTALIPQDVLLLVYQPITTVNGNAFAGATTITLNSTSNISVGQNIAINNQTLNIQALNGNNITFTPALSGNISTGTNVLKSSSSTLRDYIISKLPGLPSTTADLFTADITAQKTGATLSSILTHIKYLADKVFIDNYIKDLTGQIKEVPSFGVLASSLTDIQIQKIADYTGLNYDTIKADVLAIKASDLVSITQSKVKLINLFSNPKYHVQNTNIKNLLANPTIIDSPLLGTTLVSKMTSAHIDFLANQLLINRNVLSNDLAVAPSGTTFAQFFASSKYHGADNAGLTTSTTLAGVNAGIKSYITQIAKISTPVLDIGFSTAPPDTVFNTLTALKNYVTTNNTVTGNNTVYGASEGPMVAVNLSQFTMDSSEVNNLEFKKFMDADGYNKREYWTDAGWNWKLSNSITQPLYWSDSRYNQDNQPVVGVSWYESYAYAKWAGKRLPTEAEWEFAAKGISTAASPWGNKLYPWGNTNPRTAPTNLTNGFFGSDGSADGFKFTGPVVSLPAGNSLSGLSNMSGNVMEWVSDWYDYQYYGRSSDFTNPQGPVNGSFKSVRGGSWTHSADELRASYRELFLRPESRNLNLGFRCVKN